MLLKVVASGSSGNCYVLQSHSGERLIIECGINWNLIKRAIGFDLNSVVGVVVTHSHKDHCKSAQEVLNAGIDVYCLRETAEAIGLRGYRIKLLSINKSVKIGPFRVIGFDLIHDVPNLGFLIHHTEMGLCCYISDSCYCPNVFPGLNNIIVEANHDQELLAANSPKFLHDRIIQSHMNFETTKKLLAANDLSAVNNIVLIHLSNINSDAARFKKEVEQQTGKTVWIAENGITIPFNKEGI